MYSQRWSISFFTAQAALQNHGESILVEHG